MVEVTKEPDAAAVAQEEIEAEVVAVVEVAAEAVEDTKETSKNEIVMAQGVEIKRNLVVNVVENQDQKVEVLEVDVVEVIN
jgi:hypothetical protein